MTEFMTLAEVADYLRVTPKTIHRFLEKRSIPATKVGRQWRFDKSLIDAWLRNNSIVKTSNILVIDDDLSICNLLKDTLEESGFNVTTVTESEKVEGLITDQKYDLVLLDLKMPVIDGAELFRRIRILRPHLPVTIITGYPDSDLMAKALSHGPLGVISKPFSSSDILTAVDNYLHFSGTVR